MATTYLVGTGEAQTTITEVNALTLISGDTVSFNKGETFDDAELVCQSGVIYNAYGTGNRPIITGISLTEKTGITIDGIESRVTATSRALTINGSTNIDINDCDFNGLNNLETSKQQLVSIQGSGTVWSDDINFTDCIVRNAGFKTGTTYGGGLCINWGCKNFLIDNCTIYDNYEVNTQVYTTGSYSDYKSNNIIYRKCYVYNTTTESGGINLGWEAYDCIVEKCLVVNTASGEDYSCIGVDSGTHDNIIRNSILVGAIRAIVVLSNSTSTTKTNLRTSILNNTIIGYNNGDVVTEYGIFFNVSGGNENSGHTVKNNIFYSTYTTYQPFRSNVGVSILASDYNLFYITDVTIDQIQFRYLGTTYTGLANYRTVSGLDANSIYSDPLLTSDYRLQAGSPCIDAGTELTEVTDDYEGNPRPIGGAWDIGAYEFWATRIRNATIRNATIR